MSVAPRCVVITGSECAGKTSLTARLAGELDAPWSPEASRAYAVRVARELVASDIEPIARAQIAGEDEAAARAAGGLVLRDTDLVSTLVYARHYYGACPQWIEDAARARRADLYLLLLPDVPWIADGVRNRPAQRAQMHALFAAAFVEIGARVVTIGGGWDERTEQARRAVHALLSEHR